MLCAHAVHAGGPQITASIGEVQGPGWRASDVTVTYAQAENLRVDIAAVEWVGRLAVRNVHIACTARRAGAQLHCAGGRFAATLPAWGVQKGTLDGAFTDTEHWQARLDLPRRGLTATLDQSGARIEVSAHLRAQPAEDLRALAAALGTALPGEFSGSADVAVRAVLGAGASTASMEVTTDSLTYQEPSGRYAAENLAGQATARWDGGPQRWSVRAAGRGGQVYAEPVFVDLAALPTQAEVVAIDLSDRWRVERLRVRHGAAGTLEGTGVIGKAGPALQSADIRFDAPDLGAVFATVVQPFLIGTALDGKIGTGAARGTIALRAGTVTDVTATLDNVALTAGRLGLDVNALSGEVHWAGSQAAPSALRWGAGVIGRIPLGPSSVSFRAQGGDLELLAPWRQPLLEGALRVEQLALRNIGAAQPDADFRGALEPIDLAALCAALGWPVFGGTLGGQLPGLAVRDDVWSIQGALQAQVFDGTVRLENLHAIEPFGALPRVVGDAYLRRLDLETLTGTFAFGRITGRLDGDIRALRLLDWAPVAFDAHLYSTPNDKTRRRISQRAIDSISAIGGGPTGLLSRGFLGVFEDFSYDRMGISCVLRDGRCRMGGIEPAPAHDGRQGYYLVKGRLLPRIDMVGYAREVSWDTLVAQVRAAVASGGPQTQQ